MLVVARLPDVPAPSQSYKEAGKVGAGMGVMLNRSGLKNLGPEKLGPERLGPV